MSAYPHGSGEALALAKRAKAVPLEAPDGAQLAAPILKAIQKKGNLKFVINLIYIFNTNASCLNI